MKEKQPRLEIKVSQAFGVNAPDTMTLDGYAEASEFTPPHNPGYRFQREFFRDMFAFFKSGDKALKIVGHMGAGKTSGVLEFHSRLNKPIYTITVNEGTELGDLMGHYVLQKDGSMKWHDGPILRAYREGESVLVNEMNTLRPGVSLGLNGVLEGEPIYVPETEEVVVPATGFRFFATENLDRGEGVYNGRNDQDGSLEDRFWILHMDYMPAADETVLIKQIFTSAGYEDQIAQQQAANLVDVAGRIRKRFVAVTGAADALEVTMSTRVLVRWAKACVRFRSAESQGISPVHYALERAFTNRNMAPSTREAIHALVMEVTGATFKTRDQILAEAAAAAAGA